jgi:hypothetical protein
MYERMETQKRIAEAKRLTERLVDHTQYLLDIHENNAIVLYSNILSKQVPVSHAANAFNVFREALHQIEVVRICALWDSPSGTERESIPTVIGLIDDQKVLDAFADQERARHPAQVGDKHAERALAALKGAIKQARDLRTSAQLTSIRNLRDKHVAHYLGQTAQEKKTGPMAPMKHGDEGPVLDASIAIVEVLNSRVNDVSLSFEAARAVDRKCAEALWNACTFKIEGERK